jgi:hypothetical protein
LTHQWYQLFRTLTLGWCTAAAIAVAARAATAGEHTPIRLTSAQGNDPWTRSSACLASLTAGDRKSVAAMAVQSS